MAGERCSAFCYLLGFLFFNDPCSSVYVCSDDYRELVGKIHLTYKCTR